MAGLVDIDEFLDFLERESELLGHFDEAHLFEIGLDIRPVPGRCSNRLAEQLPAFVEPDRLDIHAGPFRQFTNLHDRYFEPYTTV